MKSNLSLDPVIPGHTDCLPAEGSLTGIPNGIVPNRIKAMLRVSIEKLTYVEVKVKTNEDEGSKFLSTY